MVELKLEKEYVVRRASVSERSATIYWHGLGLNMDKKTFKIVRDSASKAPYVSFWKWYTAITFLDEKPFSPVILDFFLHFPVKSSEPVVRKLLVGGQDTRRGGGFEFCFLRELKHE